MSSKRSQAHDSQSATVAPALRNVLTEVSTNVTTSSPSIATAKEICTTDEPAEAVLGPIKCTVIRTLLPGEDKLPRKRNIFLERTSSYEEVMAKVDLIKPQILPDEERDKYIESMAYYVTASHGKKNTMATEFNCTKSWVYALYQLQEEPRNILPRALTIEWRLIPKEPYVPPYTRTEVQGLHRTDWFKPRVALKPYSEGWDALADSIVPPGVHVTAALQARHKCLRCRVGGGRMCWIDPATGKHRVVEFHNLQIWVEAMVAGEADPMNPPASLVAKLRSYKGSYGTKEFHRPRDLEMPCFSDCSEAETEEEA